MKRMLILLKILAITLFFLLPPSFAQQKKILLKAGKIIHFIAPPLVVAEQGVEVLFGEILIKAEKIKINLNTTQTEAQGDIQLNFNQHQIRGRNLSFNLGEKEGFIENIKGKEERVSFQGKKAYLSPRKINLLEGSFTTCNLPSPHYHIKAETLEFYPGEKIIIKNATFYLGSIPLFWTPIYIYYLGKKNRLMLPQPGYSEYTGWYAKTNYLFYPSGQTEGNIHIDYYQKKGWGGGLQVSRSSKETESSINAYYIKEKDTEDVREMLRIQHISYLSTASLLKLNVNYLTDENLLEDYFYRLPDEKKQLFPSFLSVDFKEKGTGLTLQLQKRLSPKDDYPELLPRIKLNMLHPSKLLRGVYIKQNAELTHFTIQEDNITRLWSFLNLSYPETFFNRIRFKPTLGWEYFWYKPEDKNAVLNTINHQNYEFFLSLKGKMGGYLTHEVSSTLGYYRSRKSGPDLPELDSREREAKEENVLRLKMQNKFRWKNSPLFSLNLRGVYDLSPTSRGLKPVQCSLNIPLGWGDFNADFSYDFQHEIFPYFRGGITLQREKWNLGVNYSNYQSGQELASVDTSFEMGENFSVWGKIGYNLKSERVEELSYGIDAKLHCLGLKLDIQEKPFLDYTASFYITAFPF